MKKRVQGGNGGARKKEKGRSRRDTKRDLESRRKNGKRKGRY